MGDELGEWEDALLDAKICGAGWLEAKFDPHGTLVSIERIDPATIPPMAWYLDQLGDA